MVTAAQGLRGPSGGQNEWGDQVAAIRALRSGMLSTSPGKKFKRACRPDPSVLDQHDAVYNRHAFSVGEGLEIGVSALIPPSYPIFRQKENFFPFFDFIEPSVSVESPRPRASCI